MLVPKGLQLDHLREAELRRDVEIREGEITAEQITAALKLVVEAR
jgi:hypothetical protein